MHIVGPDINQDVVASFTIRDTVEAIPCPEGAVVVDKDGNQLASYADKCFVVIDGDRRDIVSAYVFDGLYTETSEPKAPVTTSQDIAAAHAAAAPTSATVGAQTDAAGNFTSDAAAALRDLTPEQRAELRAALDDADGGSSTTTSSSTTGSTVPGDQPQGGASTAGADVTAAAGSASTAETSTTATPSVAELSTTTGGDTGATGSSSTGGQ